MPAGSGSHGVRWSRPSLRLRLAQHQHRPFPQAKLDIQGQALAALGVQKRGIQLLARQLIEKRMADVLRRHAALAIPVFLEGERSQDMIDELAHLRDAPAQPGP